MCCARFRKWSHGWTTKEAKALFKVQGGCHGSIWSFLSRVGLEWFHGLVWSGVMG